MSYYKDEVVHLSNGYTFTCNYPECYNWQKLYHKLLDENLSLHKKISKLEAEIKYLNQTLR